MAEKARGAAKVAVKHAELPIMAFDSRGKWERWLAKNYRDPAGIWIRIFKKASGIRTISHAEALDVALCYGWIDGLRKGLDAQSFLQKFTPRRPRSLWSKRNVQNVERLDSEGRMKPSGWKEVELARADGRWKRAYDSGAHMKVPEYFLRALSKNSKAKVFFAKLDKANTYAIAWRLQTAAKPEIREKRMKKILDMLEKGRKLH